MINSKSICIRRTAKKQSNDTYTNKMCNHEKTSKTIPCCALVSSVDLLLRPFSSSCASLSFSSPLSCTASRKKDTSATLLLLLLLRVLWQGRAHHDVKTVRTSDRRKAQLVSPNRHFRNISEGRRRRDADLISAQGRGQRSRSSVNVVAVLVHFEGILTQDHHSTIVVEGSVVHFSLTDLYFDPTHVLLVSNHVLSVRWNFEVVGAFTIHAGRWS